MSPEASLSHDESVAMVLALQAEFAATREEIVALLDELGKKGGSPPWVGNMGSDAVTFGSILSVPSRD